MANSNYNVNLSFTADVSAAKAQLSILQQSLTELTKTSITSPTTKWTPKIKEATQAALQLKHHLENATNIKTGTLDFSKLNDSIKKSGMSLTKYGKKLQSLGPEGQQAFMELAGAVAQSEVPIKRVNKLLDDMAVTMKNTIKWQLSSSALHGFMGAIQGAYGYAQDLNKSLNDIRIVSGYNTDQMARFAKQANKAAQALSTTTTEYTNASLIYYQQGLTDAEVKERTDITIKMANAAGQSAEIVSDQMTAVWNNFDDGSKSLEYYADVMSKLGAETASSTDEIAAGLEKFSAVAGTVGLSYEYATSALATVTAETRQSADVVGTAFKTLFARIEGLSLGETLEDGTDLNKYSQALATVGVQIKDASGEMRAMDDILNDLGARWQILAKDEQIALAQTVAGVRQYNQLISLMDNWDVMQKNLSIAYGSSGTLDKQAEIYAESWEAAQSRVKAAAEDIYDSLIDEDFFINTLKGLEKLLDGIGTVTDGLGGMKGILASVSMIATKLFAGQMAEGVRNFANNLKVSTESGRKRVEQEKIDTLKTMGKDMAAGANLEGSRVGKIAAKQYEQQLFLQRQLLENQENMSEAEIAAAKQVLDIRSEIVKKVIEAATKTEETKNALADDYMQGMAEVFTASSAENEQLNIEYYRTYTKQLKDNEQALNKITALSKEYVLALDEQGGKTQASTKIIGQMGKAFRSAGMSWDEAKKKTLALSEALREADGDHTKIAQAIATHGAELLKNSQEAQVYLSALGLSDETIKKLTQDYNNLTEAERKELQIKMESEMAQKRAEENMKAQKQAVKDYADGIVAGAQALTSFVSVCTAAASIWETLNDPDLTGWERFKQTLTGVSSMVMSIISLMSSAAKAFEVLGNGKAKDTIINMMNLASEVLLAKAKKNTEKASLDAAEAQDKETEAQKKDIPTDIKSASQELKKSIATYASSIKSILAKTGVIAVAVAAAAAAIYVGVKAMNTAEDNLKETSATATDLSNSAQEARSSLESLQSGLDSLDTKKDALKNLIEGTAEYTAALQESNAAVLDLINSNEELSMADLVIDEETGAYSISRDSQERVLNAQMEKVSTAQSTNLRAQAEKEQASQNVEVDDFLEKQHEINKNMIAASAGLAGAGYGALIGGAIGSAAVPIIGNAVGMAAGAIVGAGIGVGTALAGTGHIIDEQAAAFDEIDFSQFNDPVEKLQVAADALGLDFNSLDESMKQEILALIANKEATDKNTAALLRESTKEAFKEEFEDLTESEKSLAADSVSKTRDTYAKEAQVELEKRWEKKLNGSELEEAAKLLGYEKGTEIKAIKGEDGVVRYNAIDEKGETIAELGTIKAITSTIAESYANSVTRGEDLSDYSGFITTPQNYDQGTNQAKAAAEAFDFDFEGVAEQIFNDAVTSELLTSTEIKDNSKIIEGIQAVADANGKIKDVYKGENVEAINAYYKALFGEDITTENKEEALKKLQEIKEKNEEAAEAAKQAKIDTTISNAAENYGLDAKVLKAQAGQIQNSLESQDGFDSDKTEKFAEGLEKTNLQMEDAAELATDMAIKNQRLNKGVNSLTDNWDDWKKTLKSTDKTTQDYAEALVGVEESVRDILNLTDEELIPKDFLAKDETIKLLDDIADGSEEAVEKLNYNLARAQIESQGLTKDIANNLEGMFGEELSTEQAENKFQGIKDSAISAINEMQKAFADLDPGQGLTGEKATEWANALNDYAYATGMSVEQMQQMLNKLQVKADVKVEEKKITSSVPVVEKTRTFKSKEQDPETGEWTYTWEESSRTVRHESAEEVIQVAQINTDEPVNFVKSNSGTIAPSVTSTGKNSGGGSSKPKKAEKVKKTKKSEVVERYKEITDALDDVADALDDVSKKTDRLYGTAKIKAMQQQVALMKQENQLLKQKSKEIEKNLKLDKADLNKTANEAGFTVEYDDQGNIDNYTAMMTSLYNQLAAAEAKMDKMFTKEEQDEYQENVIDGIQEKIDNLQATVDMYDETRELLTDTQKEIQDNLYEIEDLEFEAFTYEIELKIEVDDRDLEYLDYLLSKIEDKAFASAERIEIMFKQIPEIESQITTSQDAINQILEDNLNSKDYKLYSQGKVDQINFQKYIDNGTFSEAEIEELKTQSDNLLSYNESLMETRDLINQEIISAYEEWNEEIDKQMELFDHYSSIVGYMQDIADITQGMTGRDSGLSNIMANAQTEISLDRAESAKANYDAQLQAYNNAQAEYERIKSSLSEADRDAWEKNLDTMKQGVIDAEEELFSSTADAVSAAADQFSTAFDNAIKDFQTSITGTLGGLSDWTHAMEQQQTVSERYLQDYQKAYELSKLNRNIINSIDETDNVKAKQALLEVQEKLNKYAEEGVEMSQYELDYLQKEYELRLAEIALEEAQNAKSQVRMSRDSEGNWGYIYTADQDKVAEAQQSYEDKLNEITELTHNYADEVSNAILSTYQEYSDAIQDIYDRWAEGQFASEEEFKQALTDTTTFYKEQLNYQYEQLDIATNNSKTLYEDDWSSYELSTGRKIASNTSFQTSFNQTMAGMITGYDNSEIALEAFIKNIGSYGEDGKGTGLLGTLGNAYNTTTDQISGALGNIGTSLKDVKDKFKTYVGSDKTNDSILGQSNKVKKEIEADTKAMSTAMDNLMTKIGNWQKKHSTEIDTIIKKNEKAVQSFNTLNKALTDDKSNNNNNNTNTSHNNNNSNSNNSNSNKTQGDGKVQKGDKVKVKSGTKWYYDSYGTAPTGTAKDGTIKYINENGSYPYNIDGLGWVKKSDISGYDTGGYTGQWGKEGKLALLHEKELILNKGDTENFLSAMGILKEITKTIALQSIIPDVSKFAFGGNNVVEQEVTIHAEFPNVSDHNEVELALSNLINTASQYANRK